MLEIPASPRRRSSVNLSPKAAHRKFPAARFALARGKFRARQIGPSQADRIYVAAAPLIGTPASDPKRAVRLFLFNNVFEDEAG